MAEPITNVLGTVAIKHCGAYNSGTSYEKLNVVTYQGSSYCAKGVTQGNAPTDTTYWDLIAEKGDKGDTGANGTTPVKGTDYYTATDKAELEATLSNDVSSEVTEQLGDLTSTTPLVASSTAGMSDTTRIYVNTTDGYWYYHNGTAWTQGGVYQSTGLADDSVDTFKVDKNLKGLYIQNINFFTQPTPEYGKQITTYNGNIVIGTNQYFSYFKYDISSYVGETLYFVGQSYNTQKAAVITDVDGAVLYETQNTGVSKKIIISDFVKVTSGMKYLYLQMQGGNSSAFNDVLIQAGILKNFKQTGNYNSYTVLTPLAIREHSYLGPSNLVDDQNQILIQFLTGSTNSVPVYRMYRGYRYVIDGENGSSYNRVGFVLCDETFKVITKSTDLYDYDVPFNYDFTATYDGYILMTSNVISPSYVNQYDKNVLDSNVNLSDLKIGFTGDSICAGNGYTGGYAKILHDDYALNIHNIGVSGGHITHDSDQVFLISDSIDDIQNDCDGYIVEGGINDYSNSVNFGTISANYTDAVDDTTFCGALEKTFRALYTYHPGKRFAFLIVHNPNNSFFYKQANGKSWKDFRDAIYELAEKYGIDIIDVGKSGMNTYNQTVKTNYTDSGDGLHPNKDGYDNCYVPFILDWIHKTFK